MVNLIYIEEYLNENFNKFNYVLLSKNEAVDIIINICYLTTKYIFDNILEMIYHDIPVDFYNNIFELYSIQLEDLRIHYLDNNDKEATTIKLNMIYIIVLL